MRQLQTCDVIAYDIEEPKQLLVVEVFPHGMHAGVIITEATCERVTLPGTYFNEDLSSKFIDIVDHWSPERAAAALSINLFNNNTPQFEKHYHNCLTTILAQVSYGAMYDA